MYYIKGINSINMCCGSWFINVHHATEYDHKTSFYLLEVVIIRNHWSENHKKTYAVNVLTNFIYYNLQQFLLI